MGETTKACKTLLLTRPQAQSEAFLRDLTARSGPLPALISPLAVMEPTGAPVPHDGDLALTSGRAVEAAGSALKGRRAFCVGDRTAALARGAGATAISAGADAEALIAMILAERPARIIHLRGDHISTDLAERLGAAGIAASEVQVYRTRDLPLSAQARAVVEAGAMPLAPAFSPLSARKLAAALGPALSRATVAAISPAAAEPLADAAKLAIAEVPTSDAMLDLVARLWDDLPWPPCGATL
jgi:uroporphyrinogen-III synthase